MEEIRAVITQEEAKIQCNFDQMEKAIQGILAEYKGAVFTEDSNTYAKKHVASLRRQKKGLQDSLRKEKKRYMEPWDKVEVRAKKLIDMFDEPINLINGQVKAFEEERIRKKKELIGKIYSNIVPQEMEEYIQLEHIYNPKWENATTKEKTVQEEIVSILERTQKDIDTISSMESDGVQKALSMYKQNLDLTEAVSYINSYERQKQEILAKEQERRRREEEERVRREEREKILAEQRAEEEKAAAVEQAKTEAAQETIDNLIPDMEGEEDTMFCNCNLIVTQKQKEALELYMNSIGIEYEWV